MTQQTPAEVAKSGFEAAAAAIQKFRPSSRNNKPGFLHSYPQHQIPTRIDLKKSNIAGKSPRLTIKQASDQLATGETTVRSLVNYCLENIEARNEELNVFIEITPEAELLETADKLDAELASGNRRSPLHGIPISVKGIIDPPEIPRSILVVV